MQKQNRVKMNENGFAAIVIAIVLVIVLSLITVGFAALMRSEQRSALDRQLSNAAYYAAESGVNDAAAAVEAGFSAVKNKCSPFTVTDINALPASSQNAATQYLTNANVDSGSNTSYTCLLINPNPSTLEYSSVAVGKATTAVMTGADSTGATATINKLVFSWQDSSGKTFAPGGWSTNYYPPLGGWTNGDAITGILRVALTPMGAMDRNSLTMNTYTAFLYPQPGSYRPIDSAPSSDYGSSIGPQNAGVTVGGSCNTSNQPRYCEVAVTGLNQTTYLLHLSSIYRPTQVTVTPFNCSGGTCTQIYIKGAQTLIDSTGKAQDVLKRIQVRMPLSNSFDYPEFDISTVGNVCKQLSTYPPNLATGSPGGTALGVCTGL
jgi:Tfp pilus assembly protein PilX